MNTNSEYILSVLVKAKAKEAAAAAGIVGDEAVRKFTKGFGTSFYGDFFLWVNVLGVALQSFAVSRIVKLGGLRLALFVLPVISLFDSVALLTLPALLGVGELSVLRPGKIAVNASDYSINNTVRNMLWLPTSTEMKYKAKQAVDTFFVRMGDVASAGLVFVGGELLELAGPELRGRQRGARRRVARPRPQHRPREPGDDEHRRARRCARVEAGSGRRPANQRGGAPLVPRPIDFDGARYDHENETPTNPGMTTGSFRPSLVVGSDGRSFTVSGRAAAGGDSRRARV